MIPTKTKEELFECASCEKEVPLNKGAMRDLPYDELIGQVFLCNECIAEDERIYGRFESGEPYHDDLS